MRSQVSRRFWLRRRRVRYQSRATCVRKDPEASRFSGIAWYAKNPLTTDDSHPGTSRAPLDFEERASGPLHWAAWRFLEKGDPGRKVDAKDPAAVSLNAVLKKHWGGTPGRRAAVEALRLFRHAHLACLGESASDLP